MPEHKSMSEIPGPSWARFEDKYASKLEKWLNGSVWELKSGGEGVDRFKGSPESFYNAIKNYSKRSGLKIEVAQRGQSVWVRAVPVKRKPKRSTR